MLLEKGNSKMFASPEADAWAKKALWELKLLCTENLKSW